METMKIADVLTAIEGQDPEAQLLLDTVGYRIFEPVRGRVMAEYVPFGKQKARVAYFEVGQPAYFLENGNRQWLREDDILTGCYRHAGVILATWDDRRGYTTIQLFPEITQEVSSEDELMVKKDAFLAEVLKGKEDGA